jgi:hypothetical protein
LVYVGTAAIGCSARSERSYCFVEGHGFSRADEAPVLKGFSPWSLYVNNTTALRSEAAAVGDKEKQ